MKRKDFIKRSAVAAFSFGLVSKVTAGPGSHVPTPDETEGPFPTHKPSTLVAENIISDRSGLPLLINLLVYNLNAKGKGLSGAIVDIWHCDSKGEYSEYGGKEEHGHSGDLRQTPAGGPPTNGPMPKKNGANMPPPSGGGGMQTADHVKEHFLRGRQTTNSNGQVAFHSIYPGWYVSRAPHVHVHIYNSAGKSLLVTQIAFPEDISKAVYSQGVYAAHGLPETSNADDNVFNDSIANEMATLTGNTKDGFVLTHSIYVKA